jgi:hypothetical protein
MSSSGINIFLPGPDAQPEEGGRPKAAAGPTASPSRPRTLSYGRVSELVTDLMGRRFYGKLALHFEAGHIVCAKLEQSIKE